MSADQKEAPTWLEPGTGQKETNYSNPTPAPAEAQAPFDYEDHNWDALKRKIALQKEHRQEVADRLAEAQLELALLEIEIRRAELAAMKEGGRHV